MATQTKSLQKNRGRPPIGRGNQVNVMLRPELTKALDAYAVDEAASRPEAIRMILTDWLRTHGYKIVTTIKPVGPATDLVREMDKAISDHKKTRRGSPQPPVSSSQKTAVQKKNRAARPAPHRNG